MTRSVTSQRLGVLSVVMILTSIGLSVGLSLAMDIVLIQTSTDAPLLIIVGSAALFNVTVILQSVVGSTIEWRRPGHTIGRLLMLSGALYAALAAGWLTADALEPLVDPDVYRWVNWAGLLLSWPGVALIAGWIPLLFPTGTLPGPRWRIPAVILIIVSGIGLAALAVRPGPMSEGTNLVSPIAIDAWPPILEPSVDAIPFELVALIALAVASLIVRFRRGDRVERVQIRWFVAAVSLVLLGFIGVAVEVAVRTNGGPLLSALVAYAGILAMPIAIGIAVTRYRLYEIDRIISRTIGYALVTGVLVLVFIGGVLGLQSVLEPLTGGNTVAVAASTLIAAALFQPLRRRIQGAVDRRFDRARYDGQKVVDAFGRQLRDEVDLDRLRTSLLATADDVVRPVSASIWLRSVEAGR
jgi:hypothetical protein